MAAIMQHSTSSLLQPLLSAPHLLHHAATRATTSGQQRIPWASPTLGRCDGQIPAPAREESGCVALLFGISFGLCLQSVRRGRRVVARRCQADEVPSAEGGWTQVGQKADMELGVGGNQYFSLDFKDENGMAASVLRDKTTNEYVAFNRKCPHAGVDMIEGEFANIPSMTGTGPIVACPAHNFLFCTKKGSCLWDPRSRQAPVNTRPVQTYVVREMPAGDIWVKPNDLPEPFGEEQWTRELANELKTVFNAESM